MGTFSMGEEQYAWGGKQRPRSAGYTRSPRPPPSASVRPASAAVSRTQRGGVPRRPGVTHTVSSKSKVVEPPAWAPPSKQATERTKSLHAVVARAVQDNYATVVESVRKMVRNNTISCIELRQLLAFAAGVQVDDRQFGLLCGQFFEDLSGRVHIHKFLDHLGGQVKGGFRRSVQSIRT